MAARSPAVAVLLSALDRAYDRKSWHGTNLRGALRDLRAKEASWRPARGRHNVWEIVLHAAYWKYAVTRALAGGRRGSFAVAGSNWFDRGGGSEIEWRGDLALLDATHRALRDAIAHVDPDALDRRLRGRRTTRSELITGAAAHDLYHAGQIQLIKRLMPGRSIPGRRGRKR